MARQADKKNEQTKQEWALIMQVLIVLLSVCYFMTIAYKLKSNGLSSWTFGDIFWPIFYFLVEYKTYSWICADLSRGLKPMYSLDIFGVMCLSQFVSIFSTWYGTLILYLIPLYAIYKIGSLAMGYFGGGSKKGPENTEE